MVDESPTDVGSLIRFAAILLMIALAVWRNRRFHVVVVATAYALLMAWVPVTAFSF